MIIIRPVRDEDTASLQRNCFNQNTFEQTAAIVQPSLAAHDHEEIVMLVAVGDDGEVVGNCTLTRQQHRMCRHRAEIGGFVITPTWRGTGLARRILGVAREYARGWGCSILEIGCRGGTHAEDAYVGLGFQVWGRLPEGFHDHGDVRYDEVRLWMPITVEQPAPASDSA